jgi:hypothetical protein
MQIRFILLPFLIFFSVVSAFAQGIRGRVTAAGADLQSAPLNRGSVIRFNALSSKLSDKNTNGVFSQRGQVLLRCQKISLMYINTWRTDRMTGVHPISCFYKTQRHWG